MPPAPVVAWQWSTANELNPPSPAMSGAQMPASQSLSVAHAAPVQMGSGNSESSLVLLTPSKPLQPNWSTLRQSNGDTCSAAPPSVWHWAAEVHGEVQ